MTPMINFPFISATYCSKECQVADWKHGVHKLMCTNTRFVGQRVQEGDSSRNETKLENVHEQNVSAVANKIFSTHTHIILMQALLQKYDILDCVTVINLYKAPPTLEVKLASDVLPDRETNGSSEIGKRCLGQFRENGSLTVVTMALGSSGHSTAIQPLFVKTFLGIGAPFGSWTAAQENMRKIKGDDVKNLQRNPDAFERQLQHLRLVKSTFD